MIESGDHTLKSYLLLTNYHSNYLYSEGFTSINTTGSLIKAAVNGLGFYTLT